MGGTGRDSLAWTNICLEEAARRLNRGRDVTHRSGQPACPSTRERSYVRGHTRAKENRIPYHEHRVLCTGSSHGHGGLDMLLEEMRLT